MLKKTYRKSIARTVRSSLSRFLAIFAIVALGVGFLSGLLASPVDMRHSADDYYDTNRMFDVHVVSTLGLTGDDLAAIGALPGIESAQPARDTDLMLSSETGDTYTTRMHTLTGGAAGSEGINDLTLVEGRLPTKAGECVVVQTKSLLADSVSIGDALTVTPDNDKTVKDHAPTAFTVVGIVKTPVYLSMEKEHTTVGSGTVGLIAYTPLDSFSYDYYTGIYLTATGARALDSFSTSYKNVVGKVTTELDAIRPAREDARSQQVIRDANKELADAEAKYNDAKAEADTKLADAAQKLQDGKTELRKGEQKLADAKAQIDSGQQQLDDQKNQFYATVPAQQKQIRDGYTALNTYDAQLADGEAQLAAGRQGYDSQNANVTGLEQGKAAAAQLAAAFGSPLPDTSDATVLAALPGLLANPALPAENAAQLSALQGGLGALAAAGTTTEASRAALTAAKAQLDATAAQLAAQKQTLAQQRAALDAGAAKLDAGIHTATTAFADADAKLADARTQYDDGVKDLTKARKELADGQKKYDDAKAEADTKLADGAEKIADAKSAVRDIAQAEWYVWDRSDNTSYSSYDSNAEKIGNIAKVFPVFFFLVAALVALTTMTRMVEEERLQIGTLKALGYTPGQIAAKYILYAVLASLLGSLAGMLVGMKLFPSIIIGAYNIMYDVPRTLTPFNTQYGFIASGAAIGVVLIATLNACWAELREVPARLLLPKTPKAGKRILLEYITPVWRRMKFTQKVTARNLFRYKKRFFMTVFGIAGCTALLVTGFGLRDSISDIVSKQFNDLQSYQLIVALKDAGALAGRDLNEILSDKTRIEDSTPVMQNEGKVVPSGNDPADSISLEVPQDIEHFKEYFEFRHRTAPNTPVVFGENSVLVSEKLAERQHWSVGDTITVQNKDGKEASLVISDIFENYVGHYIYLSQSTYSAAFGGDAAPNLLLCKLPGGAAAGDASLPGDLLKCRDVAGTQFTTELSSSFERSMTSVNFIVFVLILSAAALAFVVLYNLTNINITEREKELATIKVLGFYNKEVSSYVYRETGVLAIIGTLCGLGFGVFLHRFVVLTAEIDLVMFGRSIYAPSYLWSALLTMVFTVLVSLVMQRKLRGISMVESLKAPE